MPDNLPSHHNLPAGYRLVDEATLSFLWFQTAGITLHYFGVGKILALSDEERLDCVTRLARLHKEHADILSEESLLVMDVLIAAAIDLTNVAER